MSVIERSVNFVKVICLGLEGWDENRDRIWWGQICALYGICMGFDKKVVFLQNETFVYYQSIRWENQR